MKLWFILILYTLPLACTPPAEPQGTPPPIISTTQSKCEVLSSLTDDETTMLFIGMTYVNQLPTLVERMADEQGIKVGTQMVAHANYAQLQSWSSDVCHFTGQDYSD